MVAETLLTDIIPHKKVENEANNGGGYPFKPVSKEQVLKDLNASEADASEGRVKDAHQAMNEIRARLGMSV